MKKSAVVVVPIYKARPDQYEIISTMRLVAVLGERPIVFAAPDLMDCSWYTSAVPGSSIETFPQRYFRSIDAYNRLLLSRRFYKRFTEYEYMLIHQLDAYVFRDELAMWCNKGYDYIGAPWFQGWEGATDDSGFIGVGNGGLSLRRINSMIRVLSTLRIRNSYKTILSRASSKYANAIWATSSALITYAVRNNTHTCINGCEYNEDVFWGLVVPSLFSDYCVADYNESYRFSFETRPSYLYKLNGSVLPFGCHAWMRYEPEFWCKYIPAS